MHSSENLHLKNKLIRCYKYKDYETAAYLSMFLSQSYPEYRLLTGIILYESNEYTRSLAHLNTLQGATALYYKALNYTKIKKYSEGIAELTSILENKTAAEMPSDPFIGRFLLDPNETEFFEALLGKLLILKGKGKQGVERYRKSMLKNPLLVPCLGLFDENSWIGLISQFETDPIMKLSQDLFKLSFQQSETATCGIKDDTSIPTSIKTFLQESPDLKVYFSNVPGFGSHFLSKAASMYCRLTTSKIGLQIFEYLREKEPSFISEMDVYSTALWINKNMNHLGLLAKDLIGTAPNNHITWSVIGNYYSLNGMSKESSTCLMKSLNIQENPFAYSLLGFEFNIRNQYLEAQNYFKSSLCMLENNDKANFGLGVAYSETGKKTAAEAYFMKALSINPKNLHMKAFLVRFYVKNDEKDKAIEKIKKYLDLECTSFDEMVGCIRKNIGRFEEMEELMICELIEILIKEKYRTLAEKLLNCVQLRTSTYYSKKSMLENDG